jgi:putative SOS response-associated peptidase YedK
MCGRYVVATPARQLALEFGAGLALEDFPPDYNVAPTKPVPAVLSRGGDRLLTALRWGLVPFWAKDPTVGARMINARVETVGEKAAFRQSFAKRRCLLPADGYYEWRKAAEPKGKKQPFYIHADGGGLLAFAGVYERWRDAEGVELWTTAILTGPADGPLARIHDRMPLTVPRDRWERWLDPAFGDPQGAMDLLARHPHWIARPVSDEVNSVRNNGERLIAPIKEDAADPGMDVPGVLF